MCATCAFDEINCIEESTVKWQMYTHREKQNIDSAKGPNIAKTVSV